MKTETSLKPFYNFDKMDDANANNVNTNHDVTTCSRWNGLKYDKLIISRKQHDFFQMLSFLAKVTFNTSLLAIFIKLHSNK